MIFASNNEGKLREIKTIFNNYEIKSLKDVQIDVDIVEDMDSFYGNALKKAKEIYRLAKIPVIADDSGLCISVLDDWPGVMTHRFLGENVTDEERNNAIIKKMEKYKGNDRKAKVVCNIVYYDGLNTISGEGILKGKISKERRGENGFGFDEIFELENGKTLAQLSRCEKNEISARRKALEVMRKKLIKVR